MKRYLLFAGNNYYPGGGWNDFIGSFHSTEAAKTALLNSDRAFQWWHIVDSEASIMVPSGLIGEFVEKRIPKIIEHNGER